MGLKYGTAQLLAMQWPQYALLSQAMSKTDDIDAQLLDAKELRLLTLLQETRSVSQSAERLGQSQPTVSIWLARMRRQFGDPLYIRTPDGMQPTARMTELFPAVRTALDALRSLSTSEPAFDPKTTVRRFRICMTDASHVTLLPQLLACLRAQAPGITVQAAQIDDTISRQLQSGEADLAVGFIPSLDAGFYQRSLYPQDWVCLTRVEHPRVGQRLSIKQYKSELHVNITSGTGHSLLQEALQREGVERNVAVELPGFLGLGAIVSSTELIATLPRHTGETLASATRLRVYPCPLPIPSFEVKQHWHERSHHDLGNRWLRGVCAELFAQRDIRRGR
jgi:DNA-binding transcriptional LysR family regulator